MNDTMANKPKPPPLDGAETEPTEHGPHGAAEHDIPAATSGKATAADADATARDAAIEARDAAAAGARRDDDEDRRRPRRTRVEREEDDDRPRALINNAAGVFVARPDPTKPISLTAPVVNGNWCGQYQGKQAHVKHGTPIEDLPSELQQLIVETRGQVVGPLPPKPQQNPFTP